MKCCALKLFLLVLAGAIINIAVSSALAVRYPPGRWKSEPIDAAMDLSWARWPADESSELVVAPSVLHTHRSIGCTILIVDQLELIDRFEGDAIPDAKSIWVQTGWPVASMDGRLWCADSDAGTAANKVYRHAIAGDRFGRSYPAYRKFLPIPLLPLWPGFALNTIFYAAMLWVLFATPRVLRRTWRIKRGLCAACGYSLRECVSEKCPECGAADSVRVQNNG